jgi:hypothetical protein
VTPERWQQIEGIFREAVRLEGDKRLAYLSKACQGDAELRVEVETLLANDRSTGPLEGSALDGLNVQEFDSAMEAWRHGGDSDKEEKPEPKRQPDRLVNDGQTIGEWLGLGDFDPVVGWLVCVKGSNQGRDYRVLSERNRIGRDAQMEICIAGDNRISRDSHAIITYEPRNNEFWLTPGLARGIAYLNGRLVDATTSLKAYDTIELGDTALQFIPFCGERFKWR